MTTIWKTCPQECPTKHSSSVYKIWNLLAEGSGTATEGSKHNINKVEAEGNGERVLKIGGKCQMEDKRAQENTPHAQKMWAESMLLKKEVEGTMAAQELQAEEIHALSSSALTITSPTSIP